MWDTPSLKIKSFDVGDDVADFGTHPCGPGACPPGQQANPWRSKKVTLNNRVYGSGEVDAYRVFRNSIPAPLAQHATVALFRNGSLVSESTYAMVETIDDDLFVEKWWPAQDWVLHEVEMDAVKVERAAGAEPAGDVSHLLDVGLGDLNRTVRAPSCAGRVRPTDRQPPRAGDAALLRRRARDGPLGWRVHCVRPRPPSLRPLPTRVVCVASRSARKTTITS